MALPGAVGLTAGEGWTISFAVVHNDVGESAVDSVGPGDFSSCCSSGRVYNVKIMIALNETTSEPGLRRAARGGVAAATYPQGGTGIPAGEINCPGAAAHMRSAAATGFRAVDGTNGFGSPPNALNINGTDTYQFVGSDPVGAVDASGDRWRIARDGKARATVAGQKGDTVASLLATKDNHGNFILLSQSEYRLWLKPEGGDSLPTTATTPLNCDEKFSVPNTAYVDQELTPWTSTTVYPTAVGIDSASSGMAI